MTLKAAPAPRVRGVVQATYAQWEVILPGEPWLFFDSLGRYLFTESRAAIIARNTGGRPWRMPHTPSSSPQCFSPVQRTLFFRGQCCHADERRASYCCAPTAPETDYAHCLKHKNQLLVAGPDRACARTDAMQLGGLFRPGARRAGNFVVRCSRQFRCLFIP